ncbi:hypothetical protein HK104_003850 [Borealophlyctis nickersoniae]|nr:hypothetical protein HK104_003850 [Borealophlyctis nickersoniae]
MNDAAAVTEGRDNGLAAGSTGFSETNTTLKRKRNDVMVLPESKSRRVAALSSRMERSLHMEQPEEDIMNGMAMDVGDIQMAQRVPAHRTVRRALRSRESSMIPLETDLLLNHNGLSGQRTPPTPTPLTPSGNYSELVTGLTDANGLVSVASWIEIQAKQRNVTVERMQAEWDGKRRELEHNLALLSSGMRNDSYEDIRAIIQKIMNTAGWLSGGNMDQLGELIPIWKMLEQCIENVVQYIRVVEDMKSTVASSFHLTGVLESDLGRMRECLDTKRQLYDNVMDGEQWRSLGLPVDEIQPQMAAFASWMYGLPWGYFMELNSEIGNMHDAQTIKSVMNYVLSGLIFAGDCADFIRRPFQPRAFDLAYHLTTAFISWTIRQYDTLADAGKARSAEAKIMLLFDNVIKALIAVLAMRGSRSRIGDRRGNEEGTSDADLPQRRELLESLGRVIVEAGLRLCTAAKSKTVTPGVGESRKTLLVALACKYVSAVVKLAGSDKHSVARIQKLIVHLPPETTV